MQTDKAYCPACQRHVELAWTPAPLHEGEANLADEGMVCLHLSDSCPGGACPLSQLPRIVMAVRLARSGLREKWPNTRLRCEGCGEVTEMEVLDDSHLLCTVCGTTNPWILLELMEHGFVAVPQSA